MPDFSLAMYSLQTKWLQHQGHDCPDALCTYNCAVSGPPTPQLQCNVAHTYRDGGEYILEAKRCNFDGAVQQQGDQWPDGSVPWGTPPLLDQKCSNCDDSDLHMSDIKDAQAEESWWRECTSHSHAISLGQSVKLTKSTKHSDINALLSVSVLSRMLDGLEEASCCVVCLSPVSSSDVATLELIYGGFLVSLRSTLRAASLHFLYIF